MTSGDFEDRNTSRWAEYEALVSSVENGRPIPGVETLPQRFRELCVDLSLAQGRMYSVDLIERLNALVIRGYKQIYRTRRGGWSAVARLVMETFPATVRQEWRLFWLCSAFFWVPFGLLIWAAHHDLTWIQSILGNSGMTRLEEMYGSNSPLSQGRGGTGADFLMFCFYIYNNVSIDFRIFAGGILAGIGTVFFIVFNGIHLGAAAGYCNAVCDPKAFWSFVVGHSSFELLGMLIAGVAGLRMGLSLLWPGRLPRARALVVGARQALPLIYGAAIMTGFAAIIEGFWSSQPLPHSWKYAVGALFWILHIVYFVFAGRRVKDAA